MTIENSDKIDGECQDVEQDSSILQFTESLQTATSKLLHDFTTHSHSYSSTITTLRSQLVETQLNVLSIQSKLTDSELKVVQFNDKEKSMRQSILSLFLFLQKQRSRDDLVLRFTFWRHKLTSQRHKRRIAHWTAKHHQHTLLRKIINAWRGATNVTWRDLTTHQIQRDAEKEVCRMGNEYALNVKGLERRNTELERELDDVKRGVEKEREMMRGLFLRYVFFEFNTAMIRY